MYIYQPGLYGYGTEMDAKGALFIFIILMALMGGGFWYSVTGHHKVGQCFHWADQNQIYKIVKVGQEHYFYEPGDYGKPYGYEGFERINEHAYFVECEK